MPAIKPDNRRCTLGVGCDEAGVCYAVANGRPEHCPKRRAWDDLKEELSRGLDE